MSPDKNPELGPGEPRGRLRAVLEAIDAENSGDPSSVEYEGASLPLALIEGRVAHDWACRLREGLREGAPAPLLIAARGHHLRRWETPRAQFPPGRQGYLTWRTHLYGVHAAHLERLMRTAAYGAEDLEAVNRIVRKQGIKTDPDVQTYEDAVALAFLEIQFGPFAARTPREALLRALRRTWLKMSEAGRNLALSLSYPPPLFDLILEATGSVGRRPDDYVT